MCIKNDNWIVNNRHIIKPFNIAQVNPASYDLRMDSDVIGLELGQEITLGYEIGIEMKKGFAVLASTIEHIKMPIDVAGTVYLKSSLARQGLDHALAGWVDPGFAGTLTLELHAHRDIVLNAGQCIIQIVFHGMDHPPKFPYQGRYQYQVGPTEARKEVASEKWQEQVERNALP